MMLLRRELCGDECRSQLLEFRHLNIVHLQLSSEVLSHRSRASLNDEQLSFKRVDIKI
jgi:hypothetical protein